MERFKISVSFEQKVEISKVFSVEASSEEEAVGKIKTLLKDEDNDSLIDLSHSDGVIFTDINSIKHCSPNNIWVLGNTLSEEL